MADTDENALVYTKEKLVQVLRDRLAAREADRQAKKEKAQAKHQEVRDRIVAALDNPQFVVWVTGRIKSAGFDPSGEGFVQKVVDTWPDTNGADVGEAHDPDRDLKRLLRAYENAENETVNIRITDEAYRYL